MALKFYWRCESETLDSTHDYCSKSGTIAMSAIGTATLDATAAKLGTYGVKTVDSSDLYTLEFAADEILNATCSVGSIGFWIQFKNSVLVTASPCGVILEDPVWNTTNNYVGPQTYATTGIATFQISMDGGAESTLRLLGSGNFTAIDTWYFVTASWDIANDKRRFRVYDVDGTVLEEAEDTATDLSAREWESPVTRRISIGNRSGNNNPVWVDNVFIGNEYDDADTFYTKRNITSYTEYTAVKKLKFFAHSSAASVSSIKAAVYSAPGGADITGATKYGEVASKTFEASLESGKAVLKIALSEIGSPALSVGATAVAVVKGTTLQTEFITGTVIEE